MAGEISILKIQKSYPLQQNCNILSYQVLKILITILQKELSVPSLVIAFECPSVHNLHLHSNLKKKNL